LTREINTDSSRIGSDSINTQWATFFGNLTIILEVQLILSSHSVGLSSLLGFYPITEIPEMLTLETDGYSNQDKI